MSSYIRKQFPIEAYQFTGNQSAPGWPEEWLNRKTFFSNEELVVYIESESDFKKVSVGDYLVKEASGYIYFFTSEDFNNTFQQI